MTDKFLNVETARDMTKRGLTKIANQETEEQKARMKQATELEARIQEEYVRIREKVETAIMANALAGLTSASFLESYPPRSGALFRLREPLERAGYTVTTKGYDDGMTVSLTVSWEMPKAQGAPPVEGAPES